ncbi:hypothetical protein K1719_029365 [Acacia pycnantha]|nr:hypothetical protein K1719_029365 [Acacia pycnantha]
MPPAKSSFSCCGDRDGGEMFGRRLEFWRAPVYYAPEAIAGVPVQVDRSEEEIKKLIEDVKYGEKLVLKCSKLQWGECLYKPQYQEQLEDLDQSLARSFQLDMQVQMARDVKETLIEVWLLLDDVSVIVITGSPGSGETTLAKKFSWDANVTGKFKDNLFVKFLKTPKLNVICSETLSTQGSEPIVDDLLMQLPDFKILVTSRFAIQRFGTPHSLKPLGFEDAMKLFRHLAKLMEKSFNIPYHIVREIVQGCSGSPMVLNAIGRSLCGQDSVVWQSRATKLSKGRPIFESNEDLLAFLQKSFDVLDTKSVIKECFLDLGLFPEDQKIPAASLVDMWVELHGEYDINAMEKIYELATRNMVDIVVSRKFASGTGNFSSLFVVRHYLFLDLAIHQRQIGQEPMEERKRPFLNITRNELPQWWTEQKEHHIAAHVLSISTDQLFFSDWCNLIPTEVEVLVLNL